MIRLIPLIVLALTLTGCQSAGMSDRETGAQTFSNYVLSLYEAPATGAAATAAAPKELKLPAHLAVAQVGETAPPQWMLDYFREHPGTFSRVEAVPGMFVQETYYRNSNTNNDPAAEAAFHRAEMQRNVERIQRIARDLGADYLFICGGDVVYGSESNPLAILDWTIIGAYIVPGKNVKGTAHAGGALVDLKTSRVAILATSQADKSSLSTWAGQDGAERRILENLRQEALHKLVEDLMARTQGADRVQVLRAVDWR